MIPNYFANLRGQWRLGGEERARGLGRRFARLAVVLGVLVAAYIGLSVLLVPGSKPREFNFIEERGSVTVLSAIFLSMGCGLGFAAFLLSAGADRMLRAFWLLVFCALGFLALDELLQFHERVGYFLDARDPLGFKSAGAMRGWNDWVVILYGLVAVPVALLFLPTLLRYPTFLKLICLAFACYVVHTAIDTVVEPPTTLSVIIEESAKLYCSAFVALGTLAGVAAHASERLQPERAAA